MPDDSRAKAEKTAQQFAERFLRPHPRTLDMDTDELTDRVRNLILSERADERRERDVEWEKALDAMVGETRRGCFIANVGDADAVRRWVKRRLGLDVRKP